MTSLLRLNLILVSLAILSAAFLAFGQPQSALAADISRIAIDTDISGTTVTPCTATTNPNVEYPCNNSTVLGPTETCRSIAVGQSIQIDVIGDSIPLGGTNGSNQPFQGAGSTDMALDWTPSGPTGPIQVTAADFSVALIHQGLGDNPGLNNDVFTGGASTDGDWFWSDVDANGNNVGEGGPGIAARLTIKGINAGIAALNIGPNTLNQPTFTDIHGNEYSVGQSTGAVIAVGNPCPPPPTVVGTAGTYCIIGNSTGIGWSWVIASTVGAGGSSYIGSVPPVLPPGALPSALANAWRDSINTAGHTGVSATSSGDCFTIVMAPSTGSTAINLFVSTGGPSCHVTAAGCSFNPIVYLVPPVGGAVTLAVSEGGASLPAMPIAAALGVLAAVLAIGGLYTRRRRL